MKISSVLECHNCQEALVGQLDDASQSIKCPKCGAMNGPGAYQNFMDPEYVSEQFRKIDDREKWLKFTKERPADKIKSCGEEFLDTLRILIYKKMSTEDLKDIVLLGREIGKISDGLHGYIESGCLYDGASQGSGSTVKTRLERYEADNANEKSYKPIARRKKDTSDDRLSNVGNVPLPGELKNGDGGVSFTDGD